jgi:hypothetical protein
MPDDVTIFFANFGAVEILKHACIELSFVSGVKEFSNSLQFLSHLLSLVSELNTKKSKYLTVFRIYRFH